jgi:riboflavin-specific deaminase-like protein
VKFTRLLPEPGTIELETLRDSLVLPSHPDRPYTIANFVSTADGRAAIHGRSAPLSSAGDRAMFHALRERVDAVIVGTNTLRIERYGRMIRDPEARQRRAERGLEPEPLACVVTRSGDLPSDIPLFTDRDEPVPRVLAFTTDDADLPAGINTVRLDPSELTLTTVLRHLHADYEIGSLLCEGGPTVFGSLLHEKLVDELFLTLSPKLAGGGMAPTIALASELPEPVPLTLKWLLEQESCLFLRCAVSTNPA